MNKPVATIGCNHYCPLSDGPKPHVGGLILEGSPNVYIEQKKTAREGDSLQCQSPILDKIQKGSNAVFINRKAAARMGDMTEHGGQLTTSAKSVFIG